MGLKTIDILATLLLNLIQYGCSEHILSCNETVLEACPDNQRCSASSHECECVEGFVRVGDDCETPADASGSHNGATVAIATIFTLALLITGVVLVVRKYNLIDYVRQKIEARRTHDVMYEDVMIGNDDPPLSP
uniref:EGF-like domain-containing protein n=1 Tax=Heliothis virescens TaxID=7102 RepID=A0A2A4JIJ8_HELVI